MAPSGQDNAYCVILGTPGSTPLSVVGPFTTIEEAQAHATEHQQKTPAVPALAGLLINPANCP